MKKLLCAILALTVILSAFLLTACEESSGGGGGSSRKGGVKITKTEASKVKYEEFDNGLISLKVPKGWKVEVPSQVDGDYVHYCFKAYDPSDRNYTFTFNLKLEGFTKSAKAKSVYSSLYPDSSYALLDAIDPQTTEAFYKVWGHNAEVANEMTFGGDYFETLEGFTLIENLGSLDFGGDVLRATFKNGKGDLLQGLFTATVYDAGEYYMYGADLAPLVVYHTIMMFAPDDEFVNWQEIYSNCIGSLEFSEKFMRGFNEQENAIVSSIKANQAIYDSTSDMIMDSWNKRNASYDITSQKRSDATLGYERVYDTETGEVYRAYNGFTDDYSGSRYKSVTDDMYTEKISGYIEK
ncbi:MAG: hypothetical protein IJV00_05305 [Clostridia bacterium]|nr:hypothetical protein [Clostridia bacterium]